MCLGSLVVDFNYSRSTSVAPLWPPGASCVAFRACHCLTPWRSYLCHHQVATDATLPTKPNPSTFPYPDPLSISTTCHPPWWSPLTSLRPLESPCHSDRCASPFPDLPFPPLPTPRLSMGRPIPMLPSGTLPFVCIGWYRHCWIITQREWVTQTRLCFWTPTLDYCVSGSALASAGCISLSHNHRPAGACLDGCECTSCWCTCPTQNYSTSCLSV